MKRIRKWWAGRNRARFYRCRSKKCGYVWARVGKEWQGPFVPAEPEDSVTVRFTFGTYYSGFVGKHTAAEVREMWSDCWPLQEIESGKMPRM